MKILRQVMEGYIRASNKRLERPTRLFLTKDQIVSLKSEIKTKQMDQTENKLKGMYFYGMEIIECETDGPHFS